MSDLITNLRKPKISISKIGDIAIFDLVVSYVACEYLFTDYLEITPRYVGGLTCIPISIVAHNIAKVSTPLTDYANKTISI